MGKYGDIAVKAADYIDAGYEPRTAWEKASCEMFPVGSAAQKKGCPRNAFLGLYGGQGKNAQYAQDAVTVLLNNQGKHFSEKELWVIVSHGVPKAYNHQMDVVLSLYYAGREYVIIKREKER